MPGSSSTISNLRVPLVMARMLPSFAEERYSRRHKRRNFRARRTLGSSCTVPGVESRDTRGDVVDLRRRELGIDRQCEHLLRGALGNRKRARRVAEVRETLLPMERHRIVDLRADAPRGKVVSKLVAPPDADHVLIKYVSLTVDGAGNTNRIADAGGFEEPRVALGIRLTRPRPAVEMRQLREQHRGLQLVEAEISADHRVVILRLSTVHAENAHPLGELRVVRHAHSGITERAEVLRRKEGEAADVADAAGSASVRELGADRLGGVLDDGEPVAARDLHQ